MPTCVDCDQYFDSVAKADAHPCGTTRYTSAKVETVYETMLNFPVLSGRVTIGHAERIIEALDRLEDRTIPEDKLTLEVGRSYLRADRRLVEIIKRRDYEGRGQHPLYFVDQHGSLYTAQGHSVNSAADQRLIDRAQKVKVGDQFDYHWKSERSIGHYTVTEVTDKGYHIEWSNEAKMFIQYGCPLNYEAIRV